VKDNFFLKKMTFLKICIKQIILEPKLVLKIQLQPPQTMTETVKETHKNTGIVL